MVSVFRGRFGAFRRNFDASRNLPSNPTLRSLKFFLEVKASPRVGSAPALNAAFHDKGCDGNTFFT